MHLLKVLDGELAGWQEMFVRTYVRRKSSGSFVLVCEREIKSPVAMHACMVCSTAR